MDVIGKIFHWLQDALFPIFCVGCEKYGEVLCEECFVKIRPYETPFCASCNARLVHPCSLNALCHYCSSTLGLDRLFIAADYDDPRAQKMVHGLKYRFLVSLASSMGRYVSERAPEWMKNSDLTLIPVPLHRRRLLERGFNQAEEIAKALSLASGQELLPSLLQRKRYTRPQVGSSKHKRAVNMNDAFVVQGIPPHSLLLIDDVFTTGATLSSCVRVLRKHGVKRVYACVFAKKIDHMTTR